MVPVTSAPPQVQISFDAYDRVRTVREAGPKVGSRRGRKSQNPQGFSTDNVNWQRVISNKGQKNFCLGQMAKRQFLEVTTNMVFPWGAYMSHGASNNTNNNNLLVLQPEG